jgi:ABC-type multidrug transport system permease subunit
VLFTRYWIADNLEKGSYELLGMILCIALGFLKIVPCGLCLHFEVVTSRKFILFWNSSSMVNYIEGVKSLHLFKCLGCAIRVSSK